MVPERPEELIAEFLPSYVQDLLAPVQSGFGTGATVNGAGRILPRRAPARAGVAFRVVGAGAWTLSVADGRLLVEPDVRADVALQVSLLARDFPSLVVRPLRRALEDAPAALPRASAGFWARLGRWDEETVDLLRRQSGGILLRLADGNVQRRVALTPGVQPYSLEAAPCTIDCALADLEQLQTKRASPLDLFYAGHVRIAGDAQIALAMAGLFL